MEYVQVRDWFEVLGRQPDLSPKQIIDLLEELAQMIRFGNSLTTAIVLVSHAYSPKRRAIEIKIQREIHKRCPGMGITEWTEKNVYLSKQLALVQRVIEQTDVALKEETM